VSIKYQCAAPDIFQKTLVLYKYKSVQTDTPTAHNLKQFGFLQFYFIFNTAGNKMWNVSDL